MIPLAAPNLVGNEARYLQQCVDTNFVSSVGPFVRQFEEGVAAVTGSIDAVATSSGTASLHLALTALGIGPGDLVVMPTFTFVATASAVAQCGATGWLFDLEQASWTLNADHVASALRQNCRLESGRLIHIDSGLVVRAILPVYAIGNPPDMGTFRKLADEFGLYLVADAAAAIGSDFRGVPIGQLADASIASFNGNKTVTCGGGGAIFGTDSDFLDRVRHLSATARVGSDYDHDAVGFNYTMTNVQAAIGCAQLERLNTFLETKREVHSFYANLSEQIDKVDGFPDGEFGKSAHWLSGMVLGTAGLTGSAINWLSLNGLPVRPFWKPMHLQHPYKDWPIDRSDGASHLWDRILVLPCSTSISTSDLETVRSKCLDFFHRHASSSASVISRGTRIGDFES